MGKFDFFSSLLLCDNFLMNNRDTYTITSYYDETKEISDEDLLIPNDKDLWSNYAITVDNGYDFANQWIKDNVEKDVTAHQKILAGWCLSLSQRFIITYTDICRVIIDMLPEHPNQPTFSQLLVKMGIDAGHERLFDRCVKYKHGEDDLVGTWNCKIADSVVEMDFDVILICKSRSQTVKQDK